MSGQNKKIIFLGLYYDEEGYKIASRYSKTKPQDQIQKWQKNLLKGFSQIGVDVTVLNVLPVGSFPINYRKLTVKQADWPNGKRIGYIDLPVLKLKLIRKKLYKEIIKIIKKEPDTAIIAYDFYQPFVEVLAKVKKNYPAVKTSLIVLDAVFGREDMYDSKRRRRLGDYLVKVAKKTDSFVVATDNLAYNLEIGERPYIVTECIADSETPANKEAKGDENIFLYTGTLNEFCGILDLIEAFTNISDAELWVCGKSGCQKAVQEYADKYENIKYFGYLSSDELNVLRDRCSFLINPRRPTGTYTKNSFPSKTFEYLLSRKPAIMYKLEGIPDEYDVYLNYITGESATKIAEEIRHILKQNYDDLRRKAKNGREFVLREKNESVQAKKILQMMDRIVIKEKNL
ncbi:MAG: hypothetical protein DBX59_00755 [Bacillota bacterium]|nr:MAG: hypothetical protein DBX59_00755 [Bacillota bacterium]